MIAYAMFAGTIIGMQRDSAAATQPQGCTNQKLRQLTRRIGRMYDARMADCGLKTTQYSLLASLDRLGPVKPGELAAALSMDPSTLTRNLQPLLEAGWVQLDPGPDARTRLASLTAAGRAKRNEARSHWKQAQQSLNRTLGAEQVARLHELIDVFQAELDRVQAG